MGFFAGGEGGYLQGVQSGGAKIADGFLHETVAGEGGHSGELRGDDDDAQMRAAFCFAVPFVHLAVVAHFQMLRVERAQFFGDGFFCACRHRFSPPLSPPALSIRAIAASKKKNVAAG